MEIVEVKQSLHRPRQALWASGRLRLPENLDSRHMKVVSLSALCTGRLYAQGDTPDSFMCTG